MVAIDVVSHSPTLHHRMQPPPRSTFSQRWRAHALVLLGCSMQAGCAAPAVAGRMDDHGARALYRILSCHYLVIVSLTLLALRGAPPHPPSPLSGASPPRAVFIHPDRPVWLAGCLLSPFIIFARHPSQFSAHVHDTPARMAFAAPPPLAARTSACNTLRTSSWLRASAPSRTPRASRRQARASADAVPAAAAAAAITS
eukprot:IDg19851t1